MVRHVVRSSFAEAAACGAFETVPSLLTSAFLLIDTRLEKEGTIANMSFSSFKNPATYHLLRYQATEQLSMLKILTEA
jgi:hypothetical protein